MDAETVARILMEGALGAGAGMLAARIPAAQNAKIMNRAMDELLQKKMLRAGENPLLKEQIKSQWLSPGIKFDANTNRYAPKPDYLGYGLTYGAGFPAAHALGRHLLDREQEHGNMMQDAWEDPRKLLDKFK